MFGNETTLDDLKQAVYDGANVIAEKHHSHAMPLANGDLITHDGWNVLLANGITISIQQGTGLCQGKGTAEVWAWKGDGKKDGDEVMRDPLPYATAEQITALAQFLGSN